ncbi:MAG: SUMF1/EgtB/PvdO family nonheme iron enzyme [Anaerolineales bacterium]
MTLGFGCSLVFFLTSYIVGFVEFAGFDETDTDDDQAVVVITEQVTATPNTVAEADNAVIQPLVVATEAPTEQMTPPEGDETAQVADDASLPTATSTPLGSAQATPTRLPEIAADQGGAETSASADSNNPGTVAQGATDDPLATAVPAQGEPTRTPAIGSAPSTPEELETIASPLVEIPGGTFVMGTTPEEGLNAVDACVVRDGGICDESYVQDSIPVHEVTLDDFQIEQTEVSVNQYVAFLNYLAEEGPSGTRVDQIACGGQPCILAQDNEPNSIIRYSAEAGQYEVVNPTFYNNHPVFFVTWFGAQEYCETIERRLPTEAEWERAARGPANSIYPWGPEWVPTNANTSRTPNAGQGTVAVDSYPGGASLYGPLNMAGNVSEWVFDFYQENYYTLPEASGPNPRGPVSSDRRVLRGGGWDNVPLFARAVHRMYAQPTSGRASIGFRCAADAP